MLLHTTLREHERVYACVLCARARCWVAAGAAHTEPILGAHVHSQHARSINRERRDVAFSFNRDAERCGGRGLIVCLGARVFGRGCICVYIFVGVYCLSESTAWSVVCVADAI